MVGLSQACDLTTQEVGLADADDALLGAEREAVPATNQR